MCYSIGHEDSQEFLTIDTVVDFLRVNKVNVQSSLSFHVLCIDIS